MRNQNKTTKSKPKKLNMFKKITYLNKRIKKLKKNYSKIKKNMEQKERGNGGS